MVMPVLALSSTVRDGPASVVLVVGLVVVGAAPAPVELVLLQHLQVQLLPVLLRFALLQEALVQPHSQTAHQ